MFIVAEYAALINCEIDAVLIVKDNNVIYRQNEAILILKSSKRQFSHPKNECLTQIFLNFNEAL